MNEPNMSEKIRCRYCDEEKNSDSEFFVFSKAKHTGVCFVCARERKFVPKEELFHQKARHDGKE